MSAPISVTWGTPSTLTLSPVPAAERTSDIYVLAGRGPVNSPTVELGIGLILDETAGAVDYTLLVRLECSYDSGEGNYFRLADASGAIQVWSVTHAAGVRARVLIPVLVPNGVESVRLVVNVPGAGQASSRILNSYIIDPGAVPL